MSKFICYRHKWKSFCHPRWHVTNDGCCSWIWVRLQRTRHALFFDGLHVQPFEAVLIQDAQHFFPPTGDHAEWSHARNVVNFRTPAMERLTENKRQVKYRYLENFKFSKKNYEHLKYLPMVIHGFFRSKVDSTSWTDSPLHSVSWWGAVQVIWDLSTLGIGWPQGQILADKERGKFLFVIILRLWDTKWFLGKREWRRQESLVE